jgi:hypothetical protein
MTDRAKPLGCMHPRFGQIDQNNPINHQYLLLGEVCQQISFCLLQGAHLSILLANFDEYSVTINCFQVNRQYIELKS